jgi:hypothetical protein
MAIHRKSSGTISIPGPCFICGKLIGMNTDEEFVFWHGVTGGQVPFIRLHPACARGLAAGLSADLLRLESAPDDDEENA